MPNFIELLSEESREAISKAGNISLPELENIVQKKRKQREYENKKRMLFLAKKKKKYGRKTKTKKKA